MAALRTRFLITGRQSLIGNARHLVNKDHSSLS
jgi:hypothetical protein